MANSYIPLTESLLDLEPEDLPPFLPGVLYALWRIGEAVPAALEEALPRIEASLSSRDPQARAMAIRCFSLPDFHEILLRHPELGSDPERAKIYHEEKLHDMSIAVFTGRLLPGGSKPCSEFHFEAAAVESGPNCLQIGLVRNAG